MDKMPLEEIILEKAGDKELQEDVELFPLSKYLAEKGYGLYLGNREIGDSRNKFWLNPKSQKYVMDYGYNFLHIVGTTLNGILLSEYLDPFPQDGDRLKRIVIESLDKLKMYLDENYLMFKTGRIEIDIIKGETRNVLNREIFEDIKSLKEKALRLNPKEVGSNKFVQDYKDFLKFYTEKIQSKYSQYIVDKKFYE